ncbi:MAG TPA: SMP-30/gluconolactonase/LRE family protein [Planctomycetota bacterium]|nr:SMP-30/gluconolactonase/LRE family protein [Planctomycetota bacterium]
MKSRLTIALLMLCPGLMAGEPSFAAKPAVTKDGPGAKISFAAAAATDCEVAVLDAKGKVVRHLAAGVLGDKAPEPLKPGLAQKLDWDGNDDLGKPAVGGPFRVRVALGLRPKFEKMIGHSPGELGSVRAIAVGPKGELFLFHTSMGIHPDDGSLTGTVFARDGKYLRTVYPWPANLPDDKLKGARRLKLGDGEAVPFICQGETRSLLPGAAEIATQQAVATGDGRVAFVGHQEWVGTTLRYNQTGTKQLVILGADGSVPEKPLGTVLATGSHCGSSLALSPDEKTLFVTGIHTPGPKKTIKGAHAVYKFGWDDKEPKAFIGSPDEAGAGEKGLKEPTSVAVDKDGNLYVADKGNGRVAAFKADGSFLGEIKVERPERVAVHRKTGAIYVLCGADLNELRKYGSWKDQAPAATAKLPCFKHANYTAVLAVDDSADPAVVWVATSSGWAGFKCLRIEDKGAAFGDQQKLESLDGIDEPAAWGVLGMALDRKGRRLLVGGRNYDLASGKWVEGLGKKNDGNKGGTGSFGLDGNFYTQSYPQTLTRYGPDLAALPFASGEKGVAKGLGGSTRLRGRGVTADPLGNVFALWQKGGGDENATSGDANNLVVHGPDGAIKNDKLVDSAIRGLNSPRLDYRGNIYLAIGARPEGKKVPAAFEGQDLGKIWTYGMNSNELAWYQLMYGCIVKFGPEGGQIGSGGGAPMEYGILEGKSGGKKTDIKGAKWIWFGASPVPSWRLSFPDTCLCESPRFDVDGYGRSFFPDAARFRCGVLDTGGNEIGFFGAYGNLDSAGPKSAVPTPEIPMLWPYMVEADDGMVYIGDRLSRRIVAVRLDHAAEETLELR